MYVLIQLIQQEEVCHHSPSRLAICLEGSNKSHVGASEKAHDKPHQGRSQQLGVIRLQGGVEGHHLSVCHHRE